MLGDDVLGRFRVVNHDCRDHAALVSAGRIAGGTELLLNRLYAEADIRICTGFIEPHFMAGFSGGPKAVVPGVAGLETVLDFHSARLIGDPRATWGDLEGNPLQQMTRDLVALMPPDAIVNVTLNGRREITGVVCGHYVAAHRLGCERARAAATVTVPAPFPVVVTTNSGYPLDQNFYQTVKGISAAARITAPGGAILCASACSAGLPPEGEFARLLRRPVAAEQLLAEILASPRTVPDQWQVQILLQCLRQARIYLHSELSAADQAATRLENCADLSATLAAWPRPAGGGRVRVAVLPLGPLTIPCLARQGRVTL
jgi:nickel-dependent lactate racemase